MSSKYIIDKGLDQIRKKIPLSYTFSDFFLFLSKIKDTERKEYTLFSHQYTEL